MLLLASRGIPDLRSHLRARGPRAVLVPTAANPLGDPGIAEEVERELVGAGLRVDRLDLEAVDATAVRAAVTGADVVAVSGGDPFHLLAAARRTGFGAATAEALAAGAVYVGYSAGAMVAGPTLAPLRLTSPLTPPPDLELAGLGLTEVLVLPHDDRHGRAAKNAQAVAAYPGVRAIPLRDGDFVVVDGSGVGVRRRQPTSTSR
ncbi:dipeptidase E [Solirubrobacter pauli]|uniref:Dipeptidase E n=1 Tax=Solirubrobacter pauli TaxID=166793 RepID=A0A660LFD3_9ACTN|nr:Type 1 glutamine amidotransferase-like domain-containing protein [Solirubrobacter pauli]RKQ93279.1 dipeptidase E [Solirubrobacter pauli]